MEKLKVHKGTHHLTQLRTGNMSTTQAQPEDFETNESYEKWLRMEHDEMIYAHPDDAEWEYQVEPQEQTDL